MKNTLTIDKERVIAAAAKCSKTKEILKTLFPEVFDPSVKILGEFVFLDEDGTSLLTKRVSLELKEKSFWLNSDSFNWQIKRDLGGVLCLIPTRK